MSIYLIEKMWLDPMENHNAFGYRTEGYVDSLKEAESIVDASKFVEKEKCWQLQYYPLMREYRFKEVTKMENK